MTVINEYRQIINRRWKECAPSVVGGIQKVEPLAGFLLFSSYLIPLATGDKYYSIVLPILAGFLLLFEVFLINSPIWQIVGAIMGAGLVLFTVFGMTSQIMGMLVFAVVMWVVFNYIRAEWEGFGSLGSALMLMYGLNKLLAFVGAALLSAIFFTEFASEFRKAPLVGRSCSKIIPSLLIGVILVISNVLIVISAAISGWVIGKWKDKGFMSIMEIGVLGVFGAFYFKSALLAFFVSALWIPIVVMSTRKWWVTLWGLMAPVLSGFVVLSFGQVSAEVGIGVVVMEIVLILWDFLSEVGLTMPLRPGLK